MGSVLMFSGSNGLRDFFPNFDSPVHIFVGQSPDFSFVKSCRTFFFTC